jgi:glyoxylase-like metal-dependent hydrolase (beta-lactamase superfamily II)
MKISYFGHSAFRIETGKSVLMIDPFLTGNPLFKGSPAEAARGATHVLLTHGHDDHLGDTVQICKGTDATLVANFEIATYLAGQGVANYSPGNHGGAFPSMISTASSPMPGIPPRHSSRAGRSISEIRPVLSSSPRAKVQRRSTSWAIPASRWT